MIREKTSLFYLISWQKNEIALQKKRWNWCANWRKGEFNYLIDWQKYWIMINKPNQKKTNGRLKTLCDKEWEENKRSSDWERRRWEARPMSIEVAKKERNVNGLEVCLHCNAKNLLPSWSHCNFSFINSIYFYWFMQTCFYSL